MNQVESALSAMKRLSVDELLLRTECASKSERAATLELIEHLAEVERRKAYAGSTGLPFYMSLFDYLRRGLLYSDSQAAERVAATRLYLQAPEIKPELDSGRLTLTGAAQLQRFVERERRLSKVTHAAADLVPLVSGKTKREVDQLLFDRASPKTRAAMNERIVPLLRPTVLDDSNLKDGQRQVSYVQVSALLDEDLLKKAKGIVYSETMSELLSNALKLYINHHEKIQGRVVPVKKQYPTKKPKKGSGASVKKKVLGRKPIGSNAQTRNQMAGRSQWLRPVPISLKRIIHARAQSRCEFIQPRTRQRCPATSALEIDHILPRALGGTNDLANLRLLCRTHNQIKSDRFEVPNDLDESRISAVRSLGKFATDPKS